MLWDAARLAVSILTPMMAPQPKATASDGLSRGCVFVGLVPPLERPKATATATEEEAAAADTAAAASAQATVNGLLRNLQRSPAPAAAAAGPGSGGAAGQPLDL